MRPLVLASVLALTAVASAQTRDVSRYEKFLIPAYSEQPIPGSHGSSWSTTLLMKNDSDQPLDLFPVGRMCFSSSSCFNTARGYPAMGPRQTSVQLPLAPAVMRVGSARLFGGFLYVERERADALSVALLLSSGTMPDAPPVAVPVVPESRFFSTRRTILGVPVGFDSRAALRVYDDGGVPRREVIVRISELSAPASPGRPPEVVAERRLQFIEQPDSCGFTFDCPEGVRYQPGIIFIGDLLAAFPELAARLHQQRYGFAVEIEPVSPGLRYYALVTVTNNATNATSVYTVR